LREISPHKIEAQNKVPKKYLMERRYSDRVTKKCQQAIFKQTGQKISEETAEIYLDKFVRLMNVTIQIMDQAEVKKLKQKTHEKNHSN
jgi:hypothetical protein